MFSSNFSFSCPKFQFHVNLTDSALYFYFSIFHFLSSIFFSPPNSTQFISSLFSSTHLFLLCFTSLFHLLHHLSLLSYPLVYSSIILIHSCSLSLSLSLSISLCLSLSLSLCLSSSLSLCLSLSPSLSLSLSFSLSLSLYSLYSADFILPLLYPLYPQFF